MAGGVECLSCPPATVTVWNMLCFCCRKLRLMQWWQLSQTQKMEGNKHPRPVSGCANVSQTLHEVVK